MIFKLGKYYKCKLYGDILRCVGDDFPRFNLVVIEDKNNVWSKPVDLQSAHKVVFNIHHDLIVMERYKETKSPNSPLWRLLRK